MKRDMYKKGNNVKQRFATRKYKVGLVSVLIGFTIFGTVTFSNIEFPIIHTVYADDNETAKDGYTLNSIGYISKSWAGHFSQGAIGNDKESWVSATVNIERIGQETAQGIQKWKLTYNRKGIWQGQESGYPKEPRLGFTLSNDLSVEGKLRFTIFDQNGNSLARNEVDPWSTWSNVISNNNAELSNITYKASAGEAKNLIVNRWYPNLEFYHIPDSQYKQEFSNRIFNNSDKAYAFQFRKPGTGYVTVEFQTKRKLLPQAELNKYNPQIMNSMLNNVQTGVAAFYYADSNWINYVMAQSDFRPVNKDTDKDGLPDDFEIYIGSDPENKDTDGDGRLDGLGGSLLEKEVKQLKTFNEDGVWKVVGTDPVVAPPQAPTLILGTKGEAITGVTKPYTTMAIRFYKTGATSGDSPVSWTSIGDTVSDANGNYSIVLGKTFATTETKNKFGNKIKLADPNNPASAEVQDAKLENIINLGLYDPNTGKFGKDGYELRVEAWSDGFNGRPLFSYPELAKPSVVVKDIKEKYSDLTPEITPVGNPDSLTEQEKDEVKEAIWNEINKTIDVNGKEIQVNKQLLDALKDGKNSIIVNDNGTAEILLNGEEDNKIELPQDKLVKKIIKLNDPEKVLVKDSDDLSDEEKEEVKEAIKKANEEAPIKSIEVGANGEATVTYNDGSTVIIPPEKTVREITYADRIVLKDPVKVEVNNPNALTDEEKEKVKENIEDANEEAPIKSIEVEANGEAIITYYDNSTATIPAEKTVVAKTDAQKTELKDPKKVEVNNPKALTEQEKKEVEKAIKEANEEAPIKSIEVGADGKATITYADDSTAEIPAEKTVIAKTDAQKTELKDPTKVEVNNPKALTEQEKEEVEKAIKDANKEAPIKSITVGNNGEATVTYNDGSTATIPAEKTVVAKTDAQKTSLQAPATKVAVDNPKALTEQEKEEVEKAIKDANKEAAIKSITVGNNGEATVTYNDDSTATIPADKTVVAKTDAQKTNLQDPKTKVAVDNPKALTEQEKEEVEKAIKDANKEAPIKSIKVGNNGEATVTYNDGSTATIPADKTVVAKNTSVKEVDKELLQEEINKANRITNTDKVNNASPLKKIAFENALKNAIDIMNNIDATQNDVNNAKKTLENSMNALDGEPIPEEVVNKEILQNEINIAEAIQSTESYENASDDQKTIFDNALNNAKEVLNNDNATQQQVNEATNVLKNAINSIQGKDITPEAVNKEALINEINKANSLIGTGKLENSTVKAKVEFERALENAKEVANSQNADQENINNAVTRLENAINSLNGFEIADKKELEKVLEKANGIVNEPIVENATESVKVNFENALDKAKDIYDKVDATQEEVNEATIKLENAINSLDGKEQDNTNNNGNSGSINNNVGNGNADNNVGNGNADNNVGNVSGNSNIDNVNNNGNLGNVSNNSSSNILGGQEATSNEKNNVVIKKVPLTSDNSLLSLFSAYLFVSMTAMTGIFALKKSQKDK